MKKTLVIMLGLCFILGITSATFAQEKKHGAMKAAQEKMDIIRGKVVSIDQAAKTIVVKDNKTQTDNSFIVSEKAIANLKVGNEVRLKVKAGDNHAEGVMVIKPEGKKK